MGRADEFGDRFAVTSSMGDTVLVHLASKAVPGIDVLFLDTGYHFIETIGTADAVEPCTDVNLLHDHAGADRGRAGRAVRQGPVHKTDPDLCCALRKVEPLNEALAAVRRVGHRRCAGPRRRPRHRPGGRLRRQARQGQGRPAGAPGPTRRSTRYIAENKVLVNPLRLRRLPVDRLRSVHPAGAPGEDARSGRWAGTDKTECGIHS